jgi:hypothetical protein
MIIWMKNINIIKLEVENQFSIPFFSGKPIVLFGGEQTDKWKTSFPHLSLIAVEWLKKYERICCENVVDGNIKNLIVLALALVLIISYIILLSSFEYCSRIIVVLV